MYEYKDGLSWLIPRPTISGGAPVSPFLSLLMFEVALRIEWGDYLWKLAASSVWLEDEVNRRTNVLEIGSILCVFYSI